jgi:hypothetical protein
MQLHYVTAPDMPSKAYDTDIGADGWVKLAMRSCPRHPFSIDRWRHHLDVCVCDSDLGDMSTFSAFVHDKATLFVKNITGFGKRPPSSSLSPASQLHISASLSCSKVNTLETAGYSIMKRQSPSADGYLLGHALVPVSCLCDAATCWG